MIIRTAVFQVNSETRDNVVKAMMAWSTIARQTRGCLTHSFYADLGDANTIRFYGEWESEEALQETTENPRFSDLWDVMKVNDVVLQGDGLTATPVSDESSPTRSN